ncbi:zinc ribbon domain-containing protein [Paraburkholderia sp. D15]|uniref:zinc ribbon domain-containing protein n=1 Tax=Paraburkholderia sp. D15 TaxID=2880218 RepID=UPI00247AE5A1|nr:zinc ribbon domain-containing protein [Paraburkholderia sp. D15]WGS51731.1 zinc ribbon domain-containing protein [Paraburkholderia sp. D15]
MAKFCVQCRATLDADAKFCDACGTPVRPPRAAQQAVSAQAHATSRAQPGMAASAGSPAPLPAPGAVEIDWRKTARWGGAALAGLAIAGGLAFWLTQPPATPTPADIETLLNANPAKVAQATCLSNFDYGKNPVNVGGFDIGTQRWMAVLTQAGLYTPPQRVNDNAIFGGSLQYAHTAEGERKIHDGKLCFAEGLSVASVEFAKPVKLGKQWHTRGVYWYAYRHADAWIQTPAAQGAVPERFADLPRTRSIALVKGEHGWEVDNATGYGYAANGDKPDAADAADPADATDSPAGTLARRALQQANANAQTDDEAAGDIGLFARLRSMVSGLFGSNPSLMGKWRDDNDKLGMLEFKPDSALLQGAPVPVSYEKDRADSKRIRVKIADGSTLATIQLIDDDHLYLSFGFFGKARFHRVG